MPVGEETFLTGNFAASQLEFAHALTWHHPFRAEPCRKPRLCARTSKALSSVIGKNWTQGNCSSVGSWLKHKAASLTYSAEADRKCSSPWSDTERQLRWQATETSIEHWPFMVNNRRSLCALKPRHVNAHTKMARTMPAKRGRGHVWEGAENWEKHDRECRLISLSLPLLLKNVVNI